ncbi:O-succinylbenzoate synthase [Candidatus Planktophila lacus]|uniref:o-succinylbenzoate synthase n=1 Tax=Candidatus Planktophila lacus TaxID=1884913 RepID=UPI000BC056E7|nr:o-succinylbenzoate synthase [Candidatus Planktophila lacus]ASY25559.1 O-succinylbenzoate synthase [Candidatus Planktophila lacus]
MLDDLLATLRVITIPTRTNFRGVTYREVALLQGPQGWGEFSPFLEYDDNECAPWLASAIEAATVARPERFRNEIAVNGTIPELNDKKEIEALMRTFSGAKTFKVKVGGNLTEDVMRVARVFSNAPKAAIRVDVNGLWSVEEALTNLYAYYEEIGPLEYVEQPCATIEELRELKRRIKIPLRIAADEVIRKATDPFKVDLTDAADVVMLKVQPLGGIRRSLEIAQHHGLPVVVSSALESAIGIEYGLELAASISDLSFDCGLATGSLLTRDVAEHKIVDGKIALGQISPKLDGLEVSPDRFEWWKNRIMRVGKLLT